MLADATNLADTLQSILTVACSCLEDTAYGLPKDCFISHGEPPDDCCDMLAIWVDRIRPSHGFGDGQYVTGGRLWDKCCDLSSVADVSLRLVRPCYPGLVDNAFNPFPEPTEIQAAAEALAIDIWVLECCLSQAHCDGVLLGGNCLELGIGDAVPHGPKGGCAGWTWDLTVELAPCCG